MSQYAEGQDGFPGVNEQKSDVPRRVLSIILKLEMLLRKSEYRGAYGFLACWWAGVLVVGFGVFPVGTSTISPVRFSAVGHIL